MGWDGGNLFLLYADGCIITEAVVDMAPAFGAADIFSSSAEFVVQKEGARGAGRCLRERPPCSADG